jgi:hypothetical protein
MQPFKPANRRAFQEYQNTKNRIPMESFGWKFGMPLRARRNLRCEWRLVAHARRWKMDGLKKRASPDRSKINMHEPREVKHWARKLGVTQERLQKVVDKVGNAAAAVRKELAT